MLFSKQLMFSEAQALTTSAASTNIIDLGATGTVKGAPAALVQDIGKGNPIPIVIRLLAAAGGTSPTLVVEIEVDTVAAFSSPTVLWTSATIAAGAAGLELYAEVYLPEGTNQRFLRLDYTAGGTSPTHSITAGIVLGKQSNTTVPGA